MTSTSKNEQLIYICLIFSSFYSTLNTGSSQLEKNWKIKKLAQFIYFLKIYFWILILFKVIPHRTPQSISTAPMTDTIGCKRAAGDDLAPVKVPKADVQDDAFEGALGFYVVSERGGIGSVQLAVVAAACGMRCRWQPDQKREVEQPDVQT